MARIGTKTLLHYVSHKLNYRNVLCLVNKNFQVTIVTAKNNQISWTALDLKVIYTYRINWTVSVIKNNEMYLITEKYNIVTYRLMEIDTKINFYIRQPIDNLCITLDHRGHNIICYITDQLVNMLWYKLSNANISEKIELLMKYRNELKAYILEVINDENRY